jgi:hypothetical protein
VEAFQESLPQFAGGITPTVLTDFHRLSLSIKQMLYSICEKITCIHMNITVQINIGGLILAFAILGLDFANGFPPP